MSKPTEGYKNSSFVQLFKAIASLQSAKEVENFFQDLCTPSELIAMADRWKIIPLLKADVPYREIHDRTGVSVTTIGRVSRSLNYGTGGYDMVLNRLKEKK